MAPPFISFYPSPKAVLYNIHWTPSAWFKSFTVIIYWPATDFYLTFKIKGLNKLGSLNKNVKIEVNKGLYSNLS